MLDDFEETLRTYLEGVLEYNPQLAGEMLADNQLRNRELGILLDELQTEGQTELVTCFVTELIKRLQLFLEEHCRD